LKTARCIHVIDGDTIELDDGERIRYEGVDALELGTPGGEEAKRVNESSVLNKIIQYEEKARDPFGRIVAQVYVDGISVNQALIDRGWRAK